MKIEEAKLGMRVGLCLSAYKLRYCNYDYGKYLEKLSYPGLIISINHHSVTIKNFKSGLVYMFHPSVLAIDE